MGNKNNFLLVLGGLLCAVGIVVPMFMPKIVLGPMSFTLASHVAIFLAMFISPKLAVMVCIGTTIGFFLTTPLIIALRAASHIVFAVIGAIIIKRNQKCLDVLFYIISLNVILAIIHAVAEVAVVSPFFFAGIMFSPEQLSGGYITSVLVLVGGGTFIHSLVDFMLALCIWKPLSSVITPLKELR